MIAGFTRGCLFAIGLLCFFSVIASANDYTISPDQWPSAINAKAKPGDRFLLRPGIYKTSSPIENLSGTQTDPIVITCSDPSNPPLIAPGNLDIRNCNHMVFDRLRIDASEPTLVSIAGKQSVGKSLSTAIRLSSISLNGNLAVSNIGSISIEKCRILRNTDWRWGAQIVQISGVMKTLITDTQIESRGMHQSLVRISDYTNLEINRSKLTGNFQEAIALGRGGTKASSSSPKDAITQVSLIHSNIFLGGDFAISTIGNHKIDVRRNSFLNQKKGLLLCVERFNGSEVPPTAVVFSENLVNHSSLEIREVIINRGSLQPELERSNSTRNIWYCQDRTRLNPDHLGLKMFRDSVYGIRPSGNVISGERFLDDLEFERILDAFQRQQRLGWWSFIAYLLVFFALASLVFTSVWKYPKGFEREAAKASGVGLDNRDAFVRPWSWIAAMLLIIYAGVRFAPFKVPPKNLFTIENFQDYRDSFNVQESSNQMLSLALLAAVLTSLFVFPFVLLRLTKAGSQKLALLQYGLRLVFVAGGLLAIDWIDFFHFGGFSPPSNRRVTAILLGAFLGLLIGLMVPRVLFGVLNALRIDFERIRWIDVTALFGIFVFLLYAWFPMEVSLDPRAMLKKLNSPRVFLLPFTKELDVPSKIIHVWHGILIGIAMSRLFQKNRHASKKTVAWSLLLLLFVEASKLLLPSKLIATDHVLLGLLGVVLSTFGISIWKTTLSFSDSSGDENTFRRWHRWMCGSSWVLLPFWVEFGWFYFWQITK